MPMRDHFHPPVSARHSWEGFHGQWPAMLVQQLVTVLPDGYTAEPRVHLGSYFETDVAGLENDCHDSPGSMSGDQGGAATALWAPPEPTLSVETNLSEQYEYEVRVYDQSRDRQLVAAVEFVSPANKDRLEHRRAFVTKSAALLQQAVSVTIVDLTTVRRFNLYAEMLEWLDHRDPSLGDDPPATYAAACRVRVVGGKSRLETWAYPLEVGRPLPTLPLWLSEDTSVALDLESSYENTCRVLRIS